MEKARDELFSHINRCGVLKATEDDQRHWLDETVEYLGERYPDLSDTELKGPVPGEVNPVFCQPAIRNTERVPVRAYGLNWVASPRVPRPLRPREEHRFRGPPRIPATEEIGAMGGYPTPH